MGQIHVDDMALEILCTGLRDFRPKSVGALAKYLALEGAHVRKQGWRL